MSVSCRVSSRIRHALVALTMVGIAACAGDRPTGPDASILAAKGGGGGGPKVTGAEPNTAPQETTLDVRVIGSGFEDGSVVKLLLAGKSTPKIVTNSTSFVDGNNLIANITIAVDADIALHDIEVTPPRGRPGVGSELFSVTQKGKPGGDVVNYTITDLGGAAVSGLNSTAALVGGRLGDPSSTFGTRRAVLWDAGTFAARDLPQLTAEANFSWAYAINSAGQVVGESNRAADEWPATPIIWETDGTIRVLLELAGQYTSQVFGINESGQVVGYRRVNDGTYRNHAVLWDTDGTITITELGELPGYDFSWAHAINNAGQVAGISNNFGDYDSGRAILWETAGGVVSILNLDPSGRSDAADIGEPAAGAVEVAGTATTASGVRVATVWTVQNGSVVTVRQLDAESGNASSADAINDVGQVVVQVSGGIAVWTPATDLLEPLPSLSKRCSSRGGDINNDGTVAGWSGVSAKGRCAQHAVVWTKN